MVVRPVCLAVLLLPLGCNLNPKGELPSATDSETDFGPEAERGGEAAEPEPDLADPGSDVPSGDGNDGPDDVVDGDVFPSAPGGEGAGGEAPGDDDSGDDEAPDDDAPMPVEEDSGPPDGGPPDAGSPKPGPHLLEALEAGADAGSDAAP
jgi:hypothetical protein